MSPSEIDRAATRFFNVVRDYVDKRVGKLNERIAELEARPTPSYEGTWKADRTYPAGTLITSSGSMWYATQDTDRRPGDGPGSKWTLCVKKGAFGR